LLTPGEHVLRRDVKIEGTGMADGGISSYL
jgi:hypothetical protein